MRSPIWTLEEIHPLPEFGGNVGWFYGLVRHHETGRVRICEIYPGIGYSSAFPLCEPRRSYFKQILNIVKDIWWAANRT